MPVQVRWFTPYSEKWSSGLWHSFAKRAGRKSCPGSNPGFSATHLPVAQLEQSGWLRTSRSGVRVFPGRPHTPSLAYRLCTGLLTRRGRFDSFRADHAGIAQSAERDVAIVEAAVSITAARTTKLRGRWPRAGLITPPLSVRFRPPRPLPGSSAGRAPLLQGGCRRFETVSGNHTYGCSSEDESATLRRSRTGVRIAPAVPPIRRSSNGRTQGFEPWGSGSSPLRRASSRSVV